ncbi:MAG TPA: sulfatase, partial [Polyangia bacterium]|nr:sulfatase [Polyangia bacterium]
GRVALAGAGAAALAVDALLPRSLYPSLRATLLTTGFVALACALGAATPRAFVGWRSRRHWQSAAATLCAGALLLLAGRALVDVSANTRFVANAQAPATALVLDAVTMVKPFAVRSLSQPATVANAGAANTAAAAPSTVAAAKSATASRADTDLAAAGDAWAQAAAPLGDAHVVIVTVDALRADRLRPEHMPLVAAATAHSLAFSRAYAAAPSTAASITALLTAHHPSHLDARPPTLAHIARANGWLTAAFFPAGLFFDGGGPLLPYANDHFGFEWVDTRTLPAEELTDAVLARVQQLVADGEPRSFLWVHYFDPHEPYELHGLPADAPPVARYDAEVAAVDGALARLINGLTNLARPTLLVITGDHGEEFGEHGGAYHGSSVYDEQLRVPLVVTVVGRAVLPAATIATPVSLVDVAPTLAALAGLPPSAGDGRPLPPLDTAPRDVVAAVHTRRMLLRWPWKLIHDLRRDVDELYDLQSDPREMRNAFDLHADVGSTLRAALGQWLN